jgi:hypothetical protein
LVSLKVRRPAFGRNAASVAVKVIRYLIYFTKKCYKIYIFNAICKDNDAVNCVTSTVLLLIPFHTKIMFIPVNFDGSYYAIHSTTTDKLHSLYTNVLIF